MYHGVINVYKEPGYTSHDVVARLRGILHQKKIGHTGTLDPAAEGVLPVCLGQATRICDLLTDKDKTYQAVLLLGCETDTQDASGQITGRFPVEISEEELRRAAESFVGDYDQIPPMYSALKVNGKKLYDLARQGKEIERKPRRVQIYSLTVDWVDLPRAGLTISCSKGTYIRTLCFDIGRALGCGGIMEQLKRTRVERFRAEDSLTLAQIEVLRDENRLDEAIIPVEEMFDCPKAYPEPRAAGLAENGNPVRAEDFARVLSAEGESIAPEELSKEGWIRVYGRGDRFLGIYEYSSRMGMWKPKKMFPGEIQQ